MANEYLTRNDSLQAEIASIEMARLKIKKEEKAKRLATRKAVIAEEMRRIAAQRRIIEEDVQDVDFS